MPVSVQESLAEVWVSGGLLQGLGALSIAVPAWDLLKEVPIIFITSTTVWPQFKQQGGNTAPPIRIRLKELQAVHPKGDQSWVFIGRTDAEAETPILWPPDVKS